MVYLYYHYLGSFPYFWAKTGVLILLLLKQNNCQKGLILWQSSVIRTKMAVLSISSFWHLGVFISGSRAAMRPFRADSVAKTLCFKETLLSRTIVCNKVPFLWSDHNMCNIHMHWDIYTSQIPAINNHMRDIPIHTHAPNTYTAIYTAMDYNCRIFLEYISPIPQGI